MAIKNSTLTVFVKPTRAAITVGPFGWAVECYDNNGTRLKTVTVGSLSEARALRNEIRGQIKSENK